MPEDQPARPDHLEERHASNLELFVDLVFVFAVTQVTSLIAHEPSWSNTGRGVLISWLVWWLWSQYVWAGTVLDLERAGDARRVMVLGSIPMALLMTIGIPTAFSDTAMLFAAAYLLTQAWMITMQGQAVWNHLPQRRAWVKFAPLAMISPVLVVIGAIFHGGARTAWWVAAALVGVGGALNSGRRRNDDSSAWSINPTHFAERHALFVIICLGEALVAIGAKVTDLLVDEAVTARLVITVIVCVAVAAAFWWVYFAFVPRVGETKLASLDGNHRGRYARDAYTFAHFPVVLGIVFYAVVAKHVVVHAGEPLGDPDRWMLSGSVVLFTGGLMLMRARTAGGISVERLGVVAVAIIAVSAGGSLDADVVLAVIAVALVAAQVITWRQYIGSELGKRTEAR